jgi:hypothetical protein
VAAVRNTRNVAAGLPESRFKAEGSKERARFMADCPVIFSP